MYIDLKGTSYFTSKGITVMGNFRMIYALKEHINLVNEPYIHIISVIFNILNRLIPIVI
jgi:hypothetical protein